MKRIFSPNNFTAVADGTKVSAFLNATDSTLDDIPSSLPEALSIAAGRIAPGTRSWVHVHPAVTQVTYVVAGDLTVKMKDTRHADPYLLEVPAGSAVVSEPGTLLQLCNESADSVEVLYIVSPAYVFEAGNDGAVIYDDSILVGEDWGSPAPEHWNAFANEEAMNEVSARRAAARQRLLSRRNAHDV